MDLKKIAVLGIGLFSFVVGATACHFMLQLRGTTAPFFRWSWGLLFIPLITLLSLEAIFEIWTSNPGPAGLGPLFFVWPTLTSGFITRIGIFAANIRWVISDSFTRNEEPFLNHWLWMLMLLTAISAVLWRFWPRPHARLF